MEQEDEKQCVDQGNQRNSFDEASWRRGMFLKYTMAILARILLLGPS